MDYDIHKFHNPLVRQWISRPLPGVPQGDHFPVDDGTNSLIFAEENTPKMFEMQYTHHNLYDF